MNQKEVNLKEDLLSNLNNFSQELKQDEIQNEESDKTVFKKHQKSFLKIQSIKRNSPKKIINDISLSNKFQFSEESQLNNKNPLQTNQIVKKQEDVPLDEDIPNNFSQELKKEEIYNEEIDKKVEKTDLDKYQFNEESQLNNKNLEQTVQPVINQNDIPLDEDIPNNFSQELKKEDLQNEESDKTIFKGELKSFLKIQSINRNSPKKVINDNSLSNKFQFIEESQLSNENPLQTEQFDTNKIPLQADLIKKIKEQNSFEEKIKKQNSNKNEEFKKDNINQIHEQNSYEVINIETTQNINFQDQQQNQCSDIMLNIQDHKYINQFEQRQQQITLKSEVLSIILSQNKSLESQIEQLYQLRGGVSRRKKSFFQISTQEKMDIFSRKWDLIFETPPLKHEENKEIKQIIQSDEISDKAQTQTKTTTLINSPSIQQDNNHFDDNYDSISLNFKENIQQQNLQEPQLNTQLTDSQIINDSQKKDESFRILNENSFEYFSQIFEGQQKLKEKYSTDDRETAFSMLKQKNYYLSKYLTSGGFGDIFIGQLKLNENNLFTFIFKICLNYVPNDIIEELNIMKSFENNINIVKLYDQIQLKNIFILVLEQCQHSLLDELKIIEQNKQFPLEQLFQIIFDLIDGLIQLRIFQTIHLDIKPGNILKTQQGIYIYTDFGISSKFQKEKIIAKAYTEKYAPQEQINDLGVSEKSDIYSLGITLKVVIQVFQKVQQQNQELCEQLQNIIQTYMYTDKIEERLECMKIHELFFKCIDKFKEFELFKFKYLKKIENIQKLVQYDSNKDILYFQDTLIYYSNLQLHILNNIKTWEQFQEIKQLEIVSSKIFLEQYQR